MQSIYHSVRMPTASIQGTVSHGHWTAMNEEWGGLISDSTHGRPGNILHSDCRTGRCQGLAILVPCIKKMCYSPILVNIGCDNGHVETALKSGVAVDLKGRWIRGRFVIIFLNTIYVSLLLRVL